MATFKTEQEIYAEVEAYARSNLPELTNWSEGSPERALARLVAFALSMAWKILYTVYANIWPTTADRAGLRNWLEVFGVPWVGQTEAVARKDVLSRFRIGAVGTAAWYEDDVKSYFPEVTEAYLFAGRRGVNTADLLVLHNGQDVLGGTLKEIQVHFDDAARKVATIDVKVLTRHDVETDLAGVEA